MIRLFARNARPRSSSYILNQESIPQNLDKYLGSEAICEVTDNKRREMNRPAAPHCEDLGIPEVTGSELAEIP